VWDQGRGKATNPIQLWKIDSKYQSNDFTLQFFTLKFRDPWLVCEQPVSRDFVSEGKRRRVALKLCFPQLV
jgi:hypothetical protein